jgi:predicted nucleotidyltransferase
MIHAAPLSEDIIHTIVQRIVERFHPVCIILFGSRARGEAGPWSDVDLLVVLPEVAHKRRAMVEILRALSDLPVATDVIVSTPEELERRGHVKGDVLRAALREGKVLYERN